MAVHGGETFFFRYGNRLKKLREMSCRGEMNFIVEQRRADDGNGRHQAHQANYDIYPPRKVNALTIWQSVVAELLIRGNYLRMVQVFGGHKNPSATEKFKQAQLEELKAAVLRHHPLG